eukprot:365965-Chlamydomonas_euryale.AAC.6
MPTVLHSLLPAILRLIDAGLQIYCAAMLTSTITWAVDQPKVQRMAWHGVEWHRSRVHCWMTMRLASEIDRFTACGGISMSTDGMGSQPGSVAPLLPARSPRNCPSQPLCQNLATRTDIAVQVRQGAGRARRWRPQRREMLAAEREDDARAASGRSLSRRGRRSCRRWRWGARWSGPEGRDQGGVAAACAQDGGSRGTAAAARAARRTGARDRAGLGCSRVRVWRMMTMSRAGGCAAYHPSHEAGDRRAEGIAPSPHTRDGRLSQQRRFAAARLGVGVRVCPQGGVPRPTVPRGGAGGLLLMLGASITRDRKASTGAGRADGQIDAVRSQSPARTCGTPDGLARRGEE